MPGGGVSIGSYQVIPVQKLVAGVRAALGRLSLTDCEEVLLRLADPDRHFEVLAELAPLALARHLVSARREATGAGGRRVDWHLTWESGAELLLEVKSRVYEIVDMLADLDSMDGHVPEPLTDPARLLKGVECKFGPAVPTSYLQGAWIQAPVKQRRDSVEEYFRQMDSARVHLVVLWSGNMADRRAYITCRDGIDGPSVLNLFGLRHSEELVFS
jgi:hypothetical protein